MARMNEQSDAAIELERMIDYYGLANVVEAMARVCYGKVDHLESTRHDRHAASWWTLNGNRLNALAPKLKF